MSQTVSDTLGLGDAETIGIDIRTGLAGSALTVPSRRGPGCEEAIAVGLWRMADDLIETWARAVKVPSGWIWY